MSAVAPGRRILLAEDDRLLGRVAEATLRRAGYTVLPARDGEETVRVARLERPDLILLDLILPKMQGFEVLRLLKRDAITADIPVIVLSNLGHEGDVQRAMASGAVSYFIKAEVAFKERREGSAIRQAAVGAGMKTMFQDGLAKALLGETTIEEVFRVVL